MLTINFNDIFLKYSKGFVCDNVVVNNILVIIKINGIHLILKKQGF